MHVRLIIVFDWKTVTAIVGAYLIRLLVKLVGDLAGPTRRPITQVIVIPENRRVDTHPTGNLLLMTTC